MEIDQLRLYLASLPKWFGYKYTPETTTHLRRALFYAFTNDGKYLSQFFSYDALPQSWKDVFAISPSSKDSWILHTNKRQHPAHPNVPCSKSFRKNEPCYRCLTCGLDETCALCSDCYNEDDHIGHEVYISICSRDIGGVCDCGDSEAWLIENNCKHHNTPEVVEEDVPKDLKSAMFRTLETVLDYFVDVLAGEGDVSLDPAKYGEGAEGNDDQKYFLVLYNDSSKHYNDAVKRIQAATMKVPEFAEMVAKRCHKYGRAVVLGSDNLDYLNQRKAILEVTGLHSVVKTYKEYFREEICAEIVNWIGDLTKGPVAGNYRLVHKLFCKALCCKWQPGLVLPSESWPLTSLAPGILQNYELLLYPAHIEGSEVYESDFYWKNSADPNEQYWNISPEICEECDYSIEDRCIEQRTIRGSRLQYLLVFDHTLSKSVRIFLHEIYVSAVVSNIVYKSLMACQYADIYSLIAEIYLTVDREYDWSFLCNLSVQLFTCPTNATLLSRHGEMKKILAAAYGFLTAKHTVFINPSTKPPVQLAALKLRRLNQLFFDLGYILQRNESPEVFFHQDFVKQICDLMVLLNGFPTCLRESEEHVEYETTDYPLYFHGANIFANFARLVSKSAFKLENSKEIVGPAIFWSLLEFLNNLNASFDNPLKTDNRTDMVFASRYGDISLYGSAVSVLKFRVDQDIVSFLHPLSIYISYLIEMAKMDDISDLQSIINQVIDTKNFVPPAGAEFIEDYPSIATTNKFKVFDIMVDYSLRTMVLLSQIKIGFWVRNGISARSQFHLYRNWGLREYGFIRDLFLIQCFCSVHKKNRDYVVATIVERWGLTSWLLQDYENYEVYQNSSNTQFMIEELLNFFIILLEFNDHMLGLSDVEINERRLLNEIIHCLCFKPLSYSELCSELPDHIVNDRRLEYVLNEVTECASSNSSSTTVCRYKLKAEYMNKINPYYIHYTSNKRDDSENIVRNQQLAEWKSQYQNDPDLLSKITYDDTYLIPKKVEVSSFFKSHKYFTGSMFFIQLLRSCLYFPLFVSKSVPAEKDQKPNFIEDGEIIRQVLELIHICIINDDTDNYFSFLCIEDLPCSNSEESIVSCLYMLLVWQSRSSADYNVDYSKFQSKVKVIMKELQIRLPSLNSYLANKFPDFEEKRLMNTFELHELNKQNSHSDNSAKKVLSESERKKKRAAERKAKIMAAFKKQQDDFLENNQDAVSDFNHASKDNSPSHDQSMSYSDYGDDSMELSLTGWRFPEETCILCQMPAENEKDLFGIIAYVTESSEFRNVPFEDKYWSMKAFCDSVNLDSDVDSPGDNSFHNEDSKCHQFLKETETQAVVGPGFPTNDFTRSVSHSVTTSCGHGMHLSCLKTHLQTARKRKSYFTKTLPEDSSNIEFVCPLCKALNNFLIPVLSSMNDHNLSELVQPSNNWRQALDINNLGRRISENYQKDFYKEVSEYSFTTMKNKYKPFFVMANEKRVSTDYDETFEELYDQFMTLRNTLGYVTLNNSQENISSLIAHTIKSIEMSLRGTASEAGTPNLLIYKLSYSQITTLRVWYDYRKNLITLRSKKQLLSYTSEEGDVSHNTLNHFGDEHVSGLEQLQKKRSELRLMEESGSYKLPIWSTDDTEIIEHHIGLLRYFCSDELYNFEDIDFLSLLVSVLPLKFLKINFNDLLRRCYTFEILKNAMALVTQLFNDSKNESDDMTISSKVSIYDLPTIPNISKENSSAAKTVFLWLKQSLNCSPVHVNSYKAVQNLGEIFYTALLKTVTPFLRGVAIWAYVIAANDSTIPEVDPLLVEPDRLAQFLNLPSLSEMLNKFCKPEEPEWEIINNLLKINVAKYTKDEDNKMILPTVKGIQLEYPGIIELISLPSRIDFFYTEYLYPKLDNDLAYDPAICLFCAKVVEFQSSMTGFKNEYGKCNLHYQTECINDGCGLFLLPKYGSILMMYNGNGSFYDAPYYDQHGEVPKDAKNTHPLRLNMKKYREFIKNIWLSHSIANYVTRKLESTIDIGGWESL